MFAYFGRLRRWFGRGDRFAATRVSRGPARHRSLKLRTAAILTAALTFTASASPAAAQGLIRDAEIENLMQDYAGPILEAAGLGSQNINIHLVNSESFNAFVVDGRNMFIHVGAIMQASTPNQLIGVIAHEAGHIAGGHLSRLRTLMQRAQSASLMLQLLSIAAAAAGAATGAGGDAAQAGQALALGGQTALMNTIMAYRRAEEYAADQAAVTYLNRTEQSGRGMIEVLEFFAERELASVGVVNPYSRTHPISRDRIQQMKQLVRQSPYYDKRDPKELRRRHALARAKLDGFMNKRNPQAVFNKYPQSDDSLPARYARAIARNFAAGVDAALPEINALIETQPNNPYFRELKGQFLLESGQVKQAIPPLKKAVELAPDAGLIRIMLAQALLAEGGKPNLNAAVDHLRKALVTEDKSATGYRQLAIAYGRLGRIADAELASAQAYFYEGKLKLAKEQAERAKAGFPPHSASWVKADDIVNFEPPQR
ncbi:M48 family metalloprotease [Dichotomicrobium thermohalophilum]|uniref:Putative Zn-dependent protease n=1 Tax=Dichotomicrobium thermohalophilum TaxID=933063 RepID=A0A397QBJ6_9HYPH|nr:M48 family metalloprotease [Dichotomicrobium thermohalophilum]RIA55474.1 putative Zn-dependent protease [Dichotomicrobium thermohalophilum]